MMRGSGIGNSAPPVQGVCCLCSSTARYRVNSTRLRDDIFCGDGEKTAASPFPARGVCVDPDQYRSRGEGGFCAIASPRETAPAMKLFLKQIRHTPLLWMLI